MLYEKKLIKVEDLLINLKNPRFNPVNSQKQAMDTMIKGMKVKIKSLANDIVNNGLNPAKLLCVIKYINGKYIVHDGNRRLIAIKLINNPDKVKNDDEFYKFFQNLKNTRHNIPKKLNCIVFENQKDASHWIELEHTGENKGVGQVRWSAEQVARFKLQKQNTDRPYIKVIDFMKKNKIFLKPGNATNFERLIDTAYVKEKIGIKYKDNKWGCTKDKTTILNNLKKVVEEINKSNLKVGEIYTAKDREKWIKKTLNEIKPKKIIIRRDGKKIKEQIIIDRKNLIPKNFTINISKNKIKLIHDELKSLEVDKYRNAVAVLFRVFLELSVKNFIKNKKLSLNPTLYQNIQTVSNYMKSNNILTTDELKPIQVATTKKTKHSILSTDTLNNYIHNVNLIPLSDDLKISWDNMQKFIEKLWE